MTTTEAHTNTQNGMTGLFGSMMGFTYASTQFTLQLLFTRPEALVDRVRITLENLSNALRDSINDHTKQHRKNGHGSDSLETVDTSARQAASQDTGRESTATPEVAADVLGGRKR